jgi:hypothetical protein
LKGERDKIAATLGAVTEHNRLAEMIVATQAHIEKLAAQVAETPPTVSSVDVQNKKLASLFSLDRNPGEGTVYWTDTWMMVAIGLIITLASQFFNMLAWLPPVGKRPEATVASNDNKPANVSREAANVSQPANVVVVKQEGDSAREFYAFLNDVLNKQKRLAA